MLRKIIAVDTNYAYRVANSFGFRFFPIAAFRNLIIQSNDTVEQVDVIETLVTLIERVPENDSAEEVATVMSTVKRLQYALEMKGCRVITCPAKRMQDGGFKQSDDQRLMISTLSTCLKLRPDFLVFVAGDGDYAPMLWELRHEGIRTEIVAARTSLASDLQRVAYGIIDLDKVLTEIKRRGESE